MKKGLVIAIVVIIAIIIVGVVFFMVYQKSAGGDMGFDFNEVDYSAGTVDLEFEGGANTLKNVETNPFRYDNEDG